MSTYKKIIHIDLQPALNKFMGKDVVHHCLKCSRGVCKTKEYHERSKGSFTTTKCHFPFISFLDTDVVITPTNIHLDITIVFTKIVDQFVNTRKWISIAYSLGVKIMVVLYWAGLSIFLWNKEEGGGLGKMGRSNKTFVKIFLYKGSNCFILLLIQVKRLLNDWLKIWFKINGMIIGFP